MQLVGETQQRIARCEQDIDNLTRYMAYFKQEIVQKDGTKKSVALPGFEEVVTRWEAEVAALQRRRQMLAAELK
jgi:hypothetical protein